ncbi:MAG TPA: hypothetical protein VHP33_14715 [Polyangiaceae bacterium]|nr:hypothetical protein [Polyangiaceae bacterium]
MTRLGRLVETPRKGDLDSIALNVGRLKVSPLSRLQAREVDKPAMLDVVRTLNGNLVQPLEEGKLAETFEEQWTKLEAKLTAIPEPSAETP